MAFQESLGKRIEKPIKRRILDVRREAQDMIQRHERQLKSLRETALSPDAFRESAMQATETFKENLRSFLTANGAEELYDELAGFVSGKVSEVVSVGRERSGK